MYDKSVTEPDPSEQFDKSSYISLTFMHSGGSGDIYDTLDIGKLFDVRNGETNVLVESPNSSPQQTWHIYDEESKAKAILPQQPLPDAFGITIYGECMVGQASYQSELDAWIYLDEIQVVGTCPIIGHKADTDTFFANCTGLRTITNASGLFNNPKYIENLRDSAKHKSISFSHTQITEIPADLFEPLSSIDTGVDFMDKAGTFMFTPITSVPDGLFEPLNKEAPHNFQTMFYCCEYLKYAPPLWEMFPNATGDACFYNCTNASNYDDIPSDWK